MHEIGPAIVKWFTDDKEIIDFTVKTLAGVMDTATV
jgi:hypothetical protein